MRHFAPIRCDKERMEHTGESDLSVLSVRKEFMKEGGDVGIEYWRD